MDVWIVWLEWGVNRVCSPFFKWVAAESRETYYIHLYPSISIYILLYPTISYYILLYPTISYYILLYPTISYYILLYPTISYYILLYPTMSTIYSMMKYDEIYDVCVWMFVAASSGEEDAQSLGQSLSRVEPGDWWKHVLHPRCSNSAIFSNHDAQLEAPIGSMFWRCSWLQFMHQWCICWLHTIYIYNHIHPCLPCHTSLTTSFVDVVRSGTPGVRRCHRRLLHPCWADDVCATWITLRPWEIGWVTEFLHPIYINLYIIYHFLHIHNIS